MAMNYGVVFPTFWTGETGRALRSDLTAQRVALYLMTSPHGNSLGVYRCPIQYIALETGSTFEDASKGLLKLCQMDFCTFDRASETVWVHEMAYYQIGATLKPKDKRQKHIQRIYEQIENPSIQQRFFEKYGAAYGLIQQPPRARPAPQDQSLSEAPSEGHQSPSEANNNFNFNDNSNSVANATGAVAPIDPAIAERELFERGRQVLGKGSGGQIAKLKAAKGGNVALARAAIEQASTKNKPGEYIAAVIRGGAGPPAFGERHTNGFVAIMEDQFRGQQHEPAPDIIDVTPNAQH